MSLFKKLRGTIETFFQLGITPYSHGIGDNTNGIEARTNNNAAQSNFVSKQALGSANVAGTDAICTNLLDLKQRDCVITQGFDGITGPIGATVGDYMICHTSGGGYIAGQIYIATAPTTGIPIPMYKMQSVCNLIAFSGTVGMIANGFYTATIGSAPFGWTLFGDGTSGAAGEVRTISIPFSFADFFAIPVPKFSTTTVPNNSIINRTSVKVNNAFLGVTLATIQVSLAGALILMATTDSNLTMVNTEFDVDDFVQVAGGGGVPVRLDFTQTVLPLIGSGYVYVEFTATPMP